MEVNQMVDMQRRIMEYITDATVCGKIRTDTINGQLAYLARGLQLQQDSPTISCVVECDDA